MTKKRIDFIVCGAQKCGTTALDYILRQHPEIQMAEKKELHFFDTERHFRFPRFTYGKYHKSFNMHDDKMLGEITPIYTYWTPVAKRLKQYSPALKLIFIYRDPVLRGFSHWNMQRKKGIEPLDFLSALQKEESRKQQYLPHQDQLFSYLDRGRYFQQVKRFLQFFDASQMLFLKYEDFLADGRETVDKICAFLSVSREFDLENKSVFAGGYSNLPDNDAISYMQSQLHEDTRQLEAQLGWDCSDWLSKKG